jgi:hypothetical protein
MAMGGAIHRKVAPVWRHHTVGYSFCAVLCLGVSEQAGHASINWGQLGLGMGYNVGYSHGLAYRHDPLSEGYGGGLCFLGGYYSIGNTTFSGARDYGDWQAGYSAGCYFSFGVSHSRSIGFSGIGRTVARWF